MRNTLLAYTVVAAASVAACHKSAPDTGAAPTPSAAVDSAAGAVTSETPTVPSAAPADSVAEAAVTAAPGAPTGNLNEMLGSQLGLSNDQATAGLGAILSYARGRLPATDFDKVAASVPGSADKIKAAEDAGAVTGPITDQAGLNAALGKLGMSPDVAAKFVPAASDYIGKLGGPEVGQIMRGLTSLR